MGRVHRRLSSAFVALVAAATVLAVPTAAHASPSDCDVYTWDVFARVGSGASFSAYGRSVELRNGRAFNHSLARIQTGGQNGDRVWIDRSRGVITRAESASKYPSTATVVRYGGGWKQCGPFTFTQSPGIVRSSGQVDNWHHAARACFRPVDGRRSVCGFWYIDRS
jgi:hypothetical protein